MNELAKELKLSFIRPPSRQTGGRTDGQTDERTDIRKHMQKRPIKNRIEFKSCQTLILYIYP